MAYSTIVCVFGLSSSPRIVAPGPIKKRCTGRFLETGAERTPRLIAWPGLDDTTNECHGRHSYQRANSGRQNRPSKSPVVHA